MRDLNELYRIMYYCVCIQNLPNSEDWAHSPLDCLVFSRFLTPTTSSLTTVEKKQTPNGVTCKTHLDLILKWISVSDSLKSRILNQPVWNFLISIIIKPLLFPSPQKKMKWPETILLFLFLSNNFLVLPSFCL